MTIAELFAYLHQLDVQLWVDGDRLRLNAPQGVLTPELSAELSTRKAELIAFLKRAQVAADAPTLPLGPAPLEQELPLSFAQERLWFLDQMEPGSIAYNLASSIHLSGVVNPQALEQAMNEIIKRHEVLRTTFVVIEGEPVQRIAPAESRKLPVVDLTHLEKPERECEVERLTQQAARTPFDLAAGPLFQLTLLCLDIADSLLILRIHHSIADGVSVEVLLRELGLFYAAFVKEESLLLPPLPIQYADFAYWQRQWLHSSILTNQLAYWQKQLSGSLPVLELLPDYLRPAVQTFCGAKLTRLLPVDLSNAVKRMVRREEVTLFILLLAAFKGLLFRHTGQTDLIVGSPISGRARAETEGLIGCFLNTLPFRTDLSGNPTFRELVKRVREVAAAAYAHQDIPFEKLVEKLQRERDLSRSPLFQVMFLQYSPMRSTHIGELALTPTPVDNGAAIFDMTMNMLDTGDGLGLLLEYNTDLFAASTMQRFLDHFQNLLESIVANPDRPIAELSLLPAAERHQLLVTWNQTEADYPADQCVHHLFEAQVERTPEGIALVCEGQTLTYRELNERANHLAHYLQQQGIEPGSLIAICTGRSPEMLVGLLGILKAGAAYLPLDPTYPKERLAFMLEDAEVTWLLTQEPLLDDLPESAARIICLDRDWAAIAANRCTENPKHGAAPDALAYVIYTSGSTGKPKGVQLPHRSVVNFLTSMQHQPGLSSDDTLLAVTTLSFDIAVLELFLPLTVGARVVLASREVAADGSLLAHALASAKATVMQATPVTWRLLLEAGWQGNSKLKILCGGEALPRDLANQLLERSASLWNMYGPTETTVWSLVHQVMRGSGPVPVGRPIANTQIYILDEHLQPVPTGVLGDLYIGGDGLALGYLRRPELTAERFIPNLFSPTLETAFEKRGTNGTGAMASPAASHPSRRIYKTGDLARYLPDGNIEFHGRGDFQVKLRGFRIELGEIETLLARHPAVRQAVVIVREDEPGDKRLVAYLLPQGDTLPSPDELRRYLNEHLPNYMIPAAFVTLERLPLTPNNKVDRRALPAPDITRPDLETGYVAPVTQTEQQLATLWKEALKVDQVGVHDNFFNLGGSSLVAVRVFGKIEREFGTKLPLATLFSAPTIAQLAAILDEVNLSSEEEGKQVTRRERKATIDWSPLVVIQPNGNRPPFFCVHAAGGNVVLYRDFARHMGEDQPVYGLQAQGLDGKEPVLESVEEMASLYVRNIKTLQPQGPYLLGGYCLGGTIALEMAQQLHAQGDKVGLVALFETYNWCNVKTSTPFAVPRYLMQKLEFHLRNFLLLHADEKRIFLKEKLKVLRDRRDVLSGTLRMRFRRSTDPDAIDPDALVSLLPARVWKVNDQASIVYQPRLYPGKIAHFRPIKEYAIYSGPELGWDALATEVETHWVRAYPAGMFVEPFVAQLARLVEQCIDQALAEGAAVGETVEVPRTFAFA